MSKLKTKISITSILLVLLLLSIAPTNASNTCTRLSGSNRLATAIAISKNSHPSSDSAGSVVLARSDAFPDGLAGAPLAYQENAPLLLTNSSSLSSSVSSEIDRTLPSSATVYLLGGTGAILDSVKTALQNKGYNVTRVSGASRIETSVEIAKRISNPTSAVLAYAHNFPDALSVSSPAAQLGMPILLTDKDHLNSSVSSYLTNHPSISTLYIVGGTSAISNTVKNEAQTISSITNVSRLSGSDRYETSRIIGSEFFSSPSYVCIATGKDFPDALAGGVHAALKNAPILLVPSSNPSQAVSYISSHSASITNSYIYGGTGVVSDGVKENVESGEISEEEASPPGETICSHDTYNYSDFTTQAEAQEVFEYCGGVANDIHRLDKDNNGVACESLP